MVGEIKIYWNKRKTKLTLEEILTWTECNDVHMYGVPLNIFEKLMLIFNNHSWEIYKNENAKALSVSMYLLNEEILTQGLANIHYIFISTKQVRKPFAYAVLRRGD